MFLQLVDPAIAEDPQVVIERWRQNNTIVDRSSDPRPRLKKAGTLRAIIGQGPSNAMVLDLRTQGPHALVGGTTGAGKSEFLQAWVLGMAAAHSPDRVTFLFVDYKGGSAFADCVELPHCVGLVTDLSPHLVRRALTSLRAELQNREHLLNRKKAKDLLELEKRQDPECPPALVLVIDEFAALASEMPEFVDGVVDIAQRGRSLGIHLIMATQRPAGVIKDNLRANTNLRIALRMADESDSRDVVDDGIAATFPATVPGRAIAKTGPGRLVPFQSAYAGGWTTEDDSAAAEVRVAELRFGASGEWEPDRPADADAHLEDLGPNDQKRIVSTLIDAADKARLMRPRRPWLDDLSPLVDLRDLPRGRYAHPARPGGRAGEAAAAGGGVRPRSRRLAGDLRDLGFGEVDPAQDDRHGGRHAARPRARAGLLPRLRLGGAGRAGVASPCRLGRGRSGRRAHPAAPAHAGRRDGSPRRGLLGGQRGFCPGVPGAEGSADAAHPDPDRQLPRVQEGLGGGGGSRTVLPHLHAHPRRGANARAAHGDHRRPRQRGAQCRGGEHLAPCRASHGRSQPVHAAGGPARRARRALRAGACSRRWS